MKFYIKWFYWYKNFGDEIIFFWLLNYLQQIYNPENFTIEVWDTIRIQQRINKNISFLDPGILDKLDFVENAEISRRFKQFQSFLGIDKYKKYFKIFGWGEVLDESRKFPHDWRNLLLLHHYCIKKWNFILVGWIGTDNKKRTKILFHKILTSAKHILCREKESVQRVTKYWIKNAEQVPDFSQSIFLRKNEKINPGKIILINISPKYFTQDNIEKIKNFIWKYDSNYKKIFFPAEIDMDKIYYSQLRKHIPDLEIYDWTKHNLPDTIDLFRSCSWGIWSRLHFLYPLQLFKKEFECLSDSDKIKKIINKK